MTVRSEDAFRRAVSHRVLFRGPAVRGHLLWAIATSFAIAALLSSAVLFERLLAGGGETIPLSPANPVTATIGWLRGLLPAAPLAMAASLLAITSLCWLLYRLFDHLAEDAARDVGRNVAGRLRRSVHRQHLRTGPGNLDRATAAAIYDRVFVDIDEIETATLATLRRCGRDPVLATALLVLALTIDWILALECLLLPAAVLSWLILRDRLAQRHHRQSLHDDRVAAHLQIVESFDRVRLAVGYGVEDYARDRLDADQANSLREAARRDRRHTSGRAIRQSLIAVGVCVILFLVLRRVLPTSLPGIPLDLPSAVVLLVAIAGLLATLDCGRGFLETTGSAGEAAVRVHEYLDRVPSVSQAVGARFLQPLAGEVCFERVSWQSHAAPSLLNGLDLVIPAGGITALLSTDPRAALATAWMLTRFIDPQAGRVLIDGQDIATGTLESLRAEVLFVAADGDCLGATVLENICCGRPEQGLTRATDAAKAVHAHHFITRLPQGYETLLHDVSSQLDAGQRFRLGLARALARNPALLVIEEPDELLDSDTKSLLSDAYDRLARDRTIVFLPGRLSTIRRADRVVLLHEGRVEETGAHEDLVRSSDLYRHWEYTRFNEFCRSPLPAGS